MSLNLENKKIILSYDQEIFDFNILFSSYLKDICPDELPNLHNGISKDLIPDRVVTHNDDQEPSIYKKLYKIDPGYNFNFENKSPKGSFLDIYKNFVNIISKDIFKEKLVYQKKPTLRVQFPGNKAVGGWHRDRDYNHPLEEINIWVPITDAYETNTIWLESSFDKGDYAPVNMSFGEMLLFDSGLTHGNKINQENKTRLSFDFRVIPFSQYQQPSSEEHPTSVAQNIKFTIGEYYEITD
jgi:hypothetical protein